MKVNKIFLNKPNFKTYHTLSTLVRYTISSIECIEKP